jgi:nitrate/nitrite transporter NarK
VLYRQAIGHTPYALFFGRDTLHDSRFTSIVGAVGGIGGFFLPLWLGALKEVTSSYRTGLWVFGLATGIAWVAVLLAERRARRLINPLEAPGRFPR